MSSSPVRRLVVTAGLALPALLVPALPALASPAAPPAPVLEVVTEGLDNPRGLTIGKDDTVYVVEGGRGGDDCRDLPPQGGHAGGDLCFGLTGSVTRVSDGVEVVPALPSFAGREGFFALGPNDVTTVGSGKFQVTISGGPLDVDKSALELRPEFSTLLGTVVRVGGGGNADRTRIVADFLAYEDARNVDGDLNNDGTPNIESNPYGILDNPGFFGGLFGATTDAAANTLLRYGPFGYIETLAVFPTREVPNPFPGGSPTVNAQSVPTSVVIGPDGAYYVGELTGFPVGAGHRAHLAGPPLRWRAAGLSRRPDHGHRPDVRPARQPLRAAGAGRGPAVEQPHRVTAPVRTWCRRARGHRERGSRVSHQRCRG